MTNRQKFIDEIDNILKESHYEILSDEALAYFEELKSGKASVGGMTDTGLKILLWLQQNTSVGQEYFSAKAIGEGLFITSRGVSGATRKLITDGYLVKEGKNPVTYALTSQGRDFSIPESEEIDKI